MSRGGCIFLVVLTIMTGGLALAIYVGYRIVRWAISRFDNAHEVHWDTREAEAAFRALPTPTELDWIQLERQRRRRLLAYVGVGVGVVVLLILIGLAG